MLRKRQSAASLQFSNTARGNIVGRTDIRHLGDDPSDFAHKVRQLINEELF